MTPILPDAPRSQAAADRVRGHLLALYGPEDADAWMPRLLARMAATERLLPGRPTPPSERLGPDASVGEDLQEQGVGDSAVDDVGLAHTRLPSARSDRFRAGFSTGRGADVTEVQT